MASFSLFGISASRGISIGRAHLIAPAAMETRHYLVPQEKVEAEVERLQKALETVQRDIENIWANLPKDAPVELGAFLDVHAMILADSMISQDPFNIIRTRRYNAEWALLTQIEQLSAKFDHIEDPYLKERKADIEQVSERIMRVLTDSRESYTVPEVPENERADMIAVAYDISPTDMLQFKDDYFSGFVSEIGGRHSHAAIVARSIDTPAIFGLSGALSLIRQDDWLIVDADDGIVIVNPAPLVMEQYRARRAAQGKARKKLNRLKKTPSVTIDGTHVGLYANIEFPEDCEAALENGAAGIGLFRSEFLFMGRSGNVSRIPDEEEQFEAYKKAVKLMKGRPVTIRTLDIGADKQIAGVQLQEKKALNPALSKRAIRYCLSEPELFIAQLKAILRASAFGPVKLLIPMLVHGFEIDQTFAFIEKAREALREENKKFDEKIPVGAMIEVPAAILALQMFLSRFDFISIGTNDLIQYALAIDRVDPEVAYLYNPVHPAVLSMLSSAVRQADAAGIPVSICGEEAGRASLTRILLGLGIREFSMHPAQLLDVKREVLSANLRTLKTRTGKILKMTNEEAVRQAVEALQEDAPPSRPAKASPV